MSTYEERQAYRDAHPGVIVDANSAYDPRTGQQTTPNFSAPGTTPATSSNAQPAANNAAAQLGAIQQSILNAIGSGNKAAADQLAHQFDQTFGLDTQKFQEQVRQYNQNFTLAQAGITGQYNGQQTEAGREFDVTQRGSAEQRAETQREFDITAKQNALDQANKTALGVLTLTAGLHSDPFRQLSTMYQANGIDGIRNAVNGISGQYGVPGSFTAPGAAGNTATLNGAVNEFNNAPQTQAQMNQVLGTFPSANQVVARNYNAAPQNVKDFTTSGLSANNGLTQQENDQLIQNTLPKFKAPDFGLAAV